MPDVYYVRPEQFPVRLPRPDQSSPGDSEDEVLGKVYEYLNSPEGRNSGIPAVEDPTELENNIRKCIFVKGQKVFGTRAPGRPRVSKPLQRGLQPGSGSIWPEPNFLKAHRSLSHQEMPEIHLTEDLGAFQASGGD